MTAFTPNYHLEKPANGEDPDTWDVPMNANTSKVDAILGGNTSVTLGGVDVTLTATQTQNKTIYLTGALTANVGVFIPFQSGSTTVAVGGQWCFYNGCSGPFSVSVFTQVSGSTGVTLQQGYRALVVSDGTNAKFADDPRIFAQPGGGLTLSGGNMAINGPLAVSLGGTGYNTYTDGDLLIGNSVTNGLTRAKLLSGSNITITPGPGSITIAATTSGGGGSGTVTSLGMDGLSTGLTFTSSTSNPITTNGTFRLGGVLLPTNGGTGATSLSGYLVGNGTSPFTTVNKIPGSDINGNITGNAASITGTVLGSQVTGNISGNAASISGTIPAGQVSGLGSMASQNAGSVSITGGNISGVTFGSLTCSSLTATSGNVTAPTFSTTGSGEYGFTGGTGLVGGSGTCGLYVSGSVIAAVSGGTFQLGAGVTPYNTVSANWTVISDERLKRNVWDYSKGLSAVLSLRPVSFEYNGMNGTPNDGKRHVGLIAQEVQATDLSDMVKPVGSYLTMDTNDLIYTLVNAVKELTARVAALEAR